MRYPWFGCALALSLAVVACGGSKSGDDDDNGGASGDGGTSGTAGSSGKGGTAGGTGAKGGTGGTGGSAGATGGSAGSGLMPIADGPFPFPQNKKPQYCELTSYSNASGAVQSAYTSWKSAYLTSAGTGLRVTRPENGGDTVSEGIAYGMLMAVYLNDRATFDGLWTYAKSHMDGMGLMNWHLNSDGTIAAQGMGSATDADEDMAWALLMASAQWENATYLGDGATMAKAIMRNEVGSDGTLTPGDSWGATDKTYPDYFSPAYFRVFSRMDVSGMSANWNTVIDRNYAILDKVSGTHGLVPDSTDSTYTTSAGYKYDACRTPWRIAMDYCWNGEPRAKAYLDKIGAFFDSQGATNIGDGYSIDGSRTSSFTNMAFVGPAGVAGMAGWPKLLNDAFTYGATGTGGPQQYYQQSLRVITMLMMSGNFLDYTGM